MRHPIILLPARAPAKPPPPRPIPSPDGAPSDPRVATRHAPAILGGVGLVSTFLALLLATVIADGLRIDGLLTWVLATLIVWLVTALGTWLLPLVFLKGRADDRREPRRD